MGSLPDPSRSLALDTRLTPSSWAAALAFLLFLASAVPAEGGWQTITSGDGLVEDHVYSMLEDRSGAIWFGTSFSGLSRYDGIHWTSFTRENGVPGDDINGSMILCLHEDRAGDLWAGVWNNGLGHYDGSTWRGITTADGLASNDVAVILEDRDGYLWFGTFGGGASRYDGAAWQTFTKADGLVSDSIMTACMDRTGGLWFGTTAGVSRYDGVTWRTYTSGDGLAAGPVRAVHEDNAGNLWFGTTSGVTRYDGTTWQTYTTADGLAHDEIALSGISGDRWGRLWFATWTGVSRFDGSTWRTYTEADGLSDERVYSSLIDASGNVWLGTNGGVSRFDGTSWKSVTMRDGLGGEQVWCALEDRAGVLWVGTGRGVSRYDGSTWRAYTTDDGLADRFTGYLFEDRAGHLWAATGPADLGNSAGVSRYDGSAWTSFSRSDGLAGDQVISMLEDRSGNYWFRTDRGLSRYDGSTWRTFTTADGLIRNNVTCMLEDRSGSLWFGTVGGVSRYDGATWRSFTMADGLADSVVSTIHEDRSGNIWLGFRSTVGRFDGSTWQSFQLEENVYAQTESIFEDLQGNLWVYALFGRLHRFDGSTWRAFTVGDVTSMLQDRAGDIWLATRNGVQRFDGDQWRSLTQSDGLLGNDVRCMLEDRLGNLWFGIIDLDGGGLSRYEPDRVSPQTVFLTVPPGLSASREHGAAFLAAFGETRRIEYSYRLDGSPWTDWSVTGSAFLTGLSQGVHVLETRSRDALANTDPTPARVGTAADPRFTSYRIELRPGGSSTWSGAALLVTSSTPVTNGLLGSWDTTSQPDGLYDLRLSVEDALGLVGTAQVTVLVDNHFPFAVETAPSIVSSTAGGDLYTNDAELHLYFPPRAFRDDALVSISTAAAVSDTLPSGAVPAGPAYLLSWAVPLSKSATLEFSTQHAPPERLAVHHSPNGSAWTRLGGTQENGTLSLSITAPGEYALFTESAPPEGSPTLSEISFTPRVFSPTGTFAQDHVAIGFTLGRSSPVTVRIYNRAGRLVREVTSGETMPPGASLVRWDGRDRAGIPVADGLYLVSVQAHGMTQRKTISVVR